MTLGMDRSRTLTPSRGWRVLLGSAGVGSMAVGVLCWLMRDDNTPRDSPTMMVVCAAGFALFGVMALALVFTDRLVVEPDAVSYRSFGITWWRLLRADVRGVRHRRVNVTRVVALVLERGRPKQVAWVYGDQDAGWLGTLPDLDERERVADHAQILADVDIGASPEDRQARLATAVRLARVLHGVSMVFATWALVYPRPLLAVAAAGIALAMTAWAAIVFGRGLFSIEGRPGEARPQVVSAVAASSAAVLPVLRGASVVDVAPVLVVGAVVASGLAVGILVTSPHQRRSRRLVSHAVLWSALSAMPLAWSANVAFDRAPGERHEVAVLDVRPAGRRSIELHLAAWGPMPADEWHEVPARDRDAYEAADAACATLHRGALGGRWFAITPCH